MNGETIADRLAGFVAGTTFGDLPEEVVDDIRLRLTDAIGLAVASSAEPFARMAWELSRWWPEPGRCTAIGFGSGFGVAAAGMVNGTLVHGQDYDDTHTETLIHASACVMPAALALAEEHRLTGRELVTVAALGYEVVIRIGLGTCPGASMQARGFHGTSVAGTCAVAAMAAWARGGGPELVRHALAIATGVAAGLRESVIDGTFAKAVQPGWAVQAGAWAAMAAAAGVTGPVRAFEGRRGLYASHAGLDACDLDRVTAELGKRWELLRIDYKLVPLCHHLQAPAEAALSIRREAGITSAEEIASVDVALSAQQITAVCEPRSACVAPDTVYGGRFSLQFSVAMAFLYGGFEPEQMARGLTDPALGRVAERVSHRVLDNPEFPTRMPIEMVVTTSDLRVYERAYPSPPGFYGRPVTKEEIESKFHRNAGPVLGGPAATELIELLREVESWPSTDALSSRLQAVKS